jgi:hypothetical protein
MSAPFLEWHSKLWTPNGGDGETAVVDTERRLGVSLPPLLRAVYVSTSLRQSQMLHLSQLKGLHVDDGVLVFGSDQQACWDWGVRLNRPNGSLVANPEQEWVDDGCSLEEWLRFFAIINRPYEPPYLDQSSFDQGKLKGTWQRVEAKWNSLQHALWTNGEAVLEEESGNLGARDRDALRGAALSLGIDEDELEEAFDGD